MKTNIQVIEDFKKHFKFVVGHVWISSFFIYVALGFLCICQLQNFSYYQKMRAISSEDIRVNVDRITLCSAREFGGKTATGIFSGVNQIALSPELLRRFRGWYAILPEDISDEIFLVSDKMNTRYKSSAVDIYTYQPREKALEFGVKKGEVIFVSRKGIKLLARKRNHIIY